MRDRSADTKPIREAAWIQRYFLMVDVQPKQNRQIEEEIAGLQANLSYIPLACDDTRSLACRGFLLVLHEGVCLMATHTRLAFHKWIRLQLCHLIGVTGVACA